MGKTAWKNLWRMTAILDGSKLPSDVVNATCSVCGRVYALDLKSASREGKLCTRCGASGRNQATALCLSRLVFGNDLPLSKQKPDYSKHVLGLSDSSNYAGVLSNKCSYINTFYHQAPFLDICSPTAEHHNKYNCLISADVFEHVIGPPSRAFDAAYRMLKPGGYLILSVPYVNKGEYEEHYPGAVGYRSFRDKDDNWMAEVEYEDGRKIVDPSAKFHGGPGKTLEMRLFNRKQLEQELSQAGFVDVQFHVENLPEHGINWGPASRIITAMRKPVYPSPQSQGEGE